MKINIKLIAMFLIFVLLMIKFSDIVLPLIIFLLPVLIIVLKFGYSIKFRDMPKLGYHIITHPLEKIIYPIFITALYCIFYLGIFLFFSIFFPLIPECLNLLKYGTWHSYSIYELMISYNKNFDFTIFDIPNWRGVENFLNWLFFEANASIAFLIIFVIYFFVALKIFNLLDKKTKEKIFKK